ncbi:uncharacterized protein [Amphiura filiformis]|uniref:uncharacterized protein n=1 Tax=Amphiura filiformis TaxID=82378 RepID=UPI003B218138
MQQCWNSDPKQRPTIRAIVMSVNALCSWSLDKEIHPRYQGKLLLSQKVACCPNGDMVVSVGVWLYLCDSDGKSKTKLKLPDVDADLNTIHFVCVSSLGHICVLLDWGVFVYVFDEDGKYLHRFSTFTPQDDFTIYHNRNIIRCMTTDGDGNVLVGSCERKKITIHSCHDGEVVSTIEWVPAIGFQPRMTVNSKKQILIQFVPLAQPLFGSQLTRCRVAAIDYTGKEMFRFKPRMQQYEGDTNGTDRSPPRGIVCDDEDNIYIAMDPGIFGVYNEGHIHKYSSTGTFLQCIAKGLHNPCDLSMTRDGSLVVANIKSILIFKLK